MQIRTGRKEKVSRKYNKLTDYLDVTAESKWIDSLKAHKASNKNISIHNSTNANIIVNKN